MSTPLKDKAHVQANPDEFRAAYARAREVFGKIEGVVGVAFGQKRTAGVYQDNVAIVVYVREKKNEEDIPPEERIPPSFEGYPTDVRVVRQGVAEVCDNATQYDKVQGGIQIMVKSGNGYGQGTLGCIVRKRNDVGRENVYLLTNKHVLYSPDNGEGENVYHPTQDDTSLGPVQAGALYGNYPYPQNNPAAPKYFLDAAIARINIDSTCCGSTCTLDRVEIAETSIVDLQVNGVNTISDVRDVTNDPLIINTKVFKVGRTTGKTAGIVRIVNAPLDADPEPTTEGGARIAAENTIYIEFDVSSPGLNNCKGNPNFTEGGDSGSIIVDDKGRAIGIHSHKGIPAAGFTLKPSHACHIVPILDYMGICIPTEFLGQSHGSANAIDGSGLGPAPLSSAGDNLVDGQFVFTAESAANIMNRPPGFPDPTPLSDEEFHHMRDLLDAFRVMERGRELRKVFGESRREIGYLIRNCRPVKVAWHRNQGPAFLAHVLNHLKGHTASVPQEIKGVTRLTLLTRMAEVLIEYGSNPLRKVLEEYREELLEVMCSSNSVQECIEYLREKEMA